MAHTRYVVTCPGPEATSLSARLTLKVAGRHYGDNLAREWYLLLASLIGIVGRGG